MDDLGSILISRDQPDDVTIRVRSPGAMTESKVTLPFIVWNRIAIPPALASSTAGDPFPRAGRKADDTEAARGGDTDGGRTAGSSPATGAMFECPICGADLAVEKDRCTYGPSREVKT